MPKTMKHYWVAIIPLLLCGCDLISDSGFATVEATPIIHPMSEHSVAWILKLQANENGVVMKDLKINNGACKVSPSEIEEANKKFSKRSGDIWSVAIFNCIAGIRTLEVHTNRGVSTVELKPLS